jgi:cbb3-type cytochrome oxidase subunit 3
MAALPDYTAWLARFFYGVIWFIVSAYPPRKGMNDLSELRECQ